MRILLPTVALMLLASPALALPPSGVYRCTLDNGGSMGELTLLAGGNYTLKDADGGSQNGQLTSTGKSIDALSGPLKDMEVTGEFSSEGGHTTLRFTQTEGIVITCS